MIGEPGIYTDIDEKTYHGDPCPTPSLSASVARVLFRQSPGHAWWAHPRLNRSKALEIEQSTKTQGMGSALHKLILGKGRPIKVLRYDNFLTNAAKAARDAAVAAGETPLLGKDMERAEVIAEAASRAIATKTVAPLFGADNGDAEVTLAWQEHNGIWCRSRIDWLPHVARQGGHITVLDLKTTGKSAHEDEWQKSLFDFGGDIQSAFYSRGLKRLIPGVRGVDFLFVVIEQEEPYAVNVCRVGNEALEYAHETVDLAIREWGECLKRGTALEHWPFYGDDVATIDPPVWRAAGGELLRLRMKSRIARWQAPLNPDKAQAA